MRQAMNGTMPHITQYQGSKRILAPQILPYMPLRFRRLVEPFAGMAAITIAAAQQHRARLYHVNDINAPLVEILREAIENPEGLSRQYAEVWSEQFAHPEGSVAHFYKVRQDFNQGNASAGNLLYLIARCVKGAVRYGGDGHFNQSPDKRRHGTHPKTLAKNLFAISALLKDRTTFSSEDYRQVLRHVGKGDLVYMDPPYQGVSNTRDNRYLSGIPFDEFAEAIDRLNASGADFLISYDGTCGEKTYGQDLPPCLGVKKVMLNAGLSSQGLLLGKKVVTHEALYISKGLQGLFPQPAPQLQLFHQAKA